MWNMVDWEGAKERHAELLQEAHESRIAAKFSRRSALTTRILQTLARWRTGARQIGEATPAHPRTDALPDQG